MNSILIRCRRLYTLIYSSPLTSLQVKKLEKIEEISREQTPKIRFWYPWVRRFTKFWLIFFEEEKRHCASEKTLLHLKPISLAIMSETASISDMMRRFHDNPPTSRAERESARAEGKRPDAMWWSTANKGPGNEKDVAIRGDSRTHVSAAQSRPDERFEHSDEGEPRIGSTLTRPEPATKSVSAQSRLAKYESTCFITMLCTR